MEHNTQIEIPPGFIKDIVHMENSALKVYLVLKELAQIKKENGQLDENECARVYCGYEYIEKVSGVVKSTARRAIISLSENGWICGFTRGHTSGNRHTRISNEYIIPFERRYDKKSHYEMLKWNSKKGV